MLSTFLSKIGLAIVHYLLERTSFKYNTFPQTQSGPHSSLR